MITARQLYGPMANLSATSSSELRDYSWWKSEAFADVLARAVRATPAPAHTSNKSVQAQVYANLVASRIPPKLALILLPRMKKHLCNAGIVYNDDWLTTEMERSLAVVKKAPRKAPAQVGWALIRTWCNG